MNITSLQGFQSELHKDIALALLGVKAAKLREDADDIKGAINCYKYSLDLMTANSEKVPSELKSNFQEKVFIFKFYFIQLSI